MNKTKLYSRGNYHVALLAVSMTPSFVFADSTILFDGVDSYVEMTPWQPSGSYEITAKLSDVSTARTYLASSSQDNEYLSFYPQTVQGQFGSKWPGIWGKFDFSSTNYIKIRVKEGSLYASDGVNESTVYDSSISPSSAYYDRLFRRSNTYSEGGLESITFTDLENSSNDRTITFDNNGTPIVASSDSASAYAYNVDAAYVTTTADTSTGSSSSDSTSTDSTSTDSTSNDATTTAQFNGSNSYVEMTPWVPTGSYKVMAWLDDVSTNSSDKVVLASNSSTNEYIGYYPKSVQGQFGSSSWPGVWGKMDFSTTKYVEVTVEDGYMLASDGITEAKTSDSNISPSSVSYDRLFRRGGSYSDGSLLAIAFIDLNDSDNYRIMTFDADGQPIVTSPDNVDATAHNMTSVETSDSLTDQQIASIQELETAYSISMLTYANTDTEQTASSSDDSTTDSSSDDEQVADNDVADSTDSDEEEEVASSTDSAVSDDDQVTATINGAVTFNGSNAYAEMTPWTPTGSYKVMAWVDDVSSSSSEKVVLASNSSTNEYIGYYPKSVQAQFGSKSWPGVWGKMDFSDTKYVEVTIAQGSITASDGNSGGSTSDSNITTSSVSYDRLFRRGGSYSSGTLLGIAFIDLNDSDNYRIITFDTNGDPVVTSASTASVSLVNTTSAGSSTNLTDEQVASLQDLDMSSSDTTTTEEADEVVASTDTSDTTTEEEADEVDNTTTDTTASTDTDTDTDVTDTTTSTDDQATETVSNSSDTSNNGLKFSGTSSYAQMSDWTPSGEHRVVAWLGSLSLSNSDKMVYLAADSGNGNYIAFNANSVETKINGTVVSSSANMNFSSTNFIEVILKDGSMTISDGANDSTIYNSAIDASDMSYDRLFQMEDNSSNGVLQSIAFIDVNNTTNGRTIAFDTTGQPVIISSDDASVALYNINQDDIVTGLSVPNPEVSYITSASDLGDLIVKNYPGMPMMSDDDADSEDYAWQGYYWLRTYINLYEATGNSDYIDWAVELAEFMFYNTDDLRAERNGTSVNNYVSAPKYYLNNRDEFAPGWVRNSFKRVLLLDDGMILSAIMRLVDVIKSDGISAYNDEANEFMRRSIIIADSHDSSWSETKQSTIAGSWFYVANVNENYGDSGLWSNPVSYNHSLAMATAMLYLDKWTSGGIDEYQNKLDKIETFFESYVTYFDDNTCEWSYTWESDGDELVEDLVHGHIDVGYFVIADEEGYLDDDTIPKCMAATVANNMLIGPGVAPNRVDGDGVGIELEQLSMTYDYRGLAKFEPSIIARSNNNIRQFVSLTWFRAYAALSESFVD